MFVLACSNHRHAGDRARPAPADPVVWPRAGSRLPTPTGRSWPREQTVGGGAERREPRAGRSRMTPGPRARRTPASRLMAPRPPRPPPPGVPGEVRPGAPEPSEVPGNPLLSALPAVAANPLQRNLISAPFFLPFYTCTDQEQVFYVECGFKPQQPLHRQEYK